MNLMEVLGVFLRRAMDGDDWDEVEDDVIESMMVNGFEPEEIDSAITMVERLRERLEFGHYTAGPIQTDRLFQIMEEFFLTVEARGYLIRLVETGIVSALEREELVERCLLMDAREIGLEELKSALQTLLIGEDVEPGTPEVHLPFEGH